MMTNAGNRKALLKMKKYSGSRIGTEGTIDKIHRKFREAGTALRNLHEILEEEAKRIARELHDEAGQLLASVHIALKQGARDLPASAREGIYEVRKMLYQVEAQIRRLSHELRPTVLDDLGLLPAIEFLAQGISERTGIAISVEGKTDGRFPVLIVTTLYRIVQEALNNVVKHAQATKVTISLQQEDEKVCCTVQDNGVGFQWTEALAKKGERGIGLIGMRERLSALCGQLEIKTAPGQGTQLRINIPLRV